MLQRHTQLHVHTDEDTQILFQKCELQDYYENLARDERTTWPCVFRGDDGGGGGDPKSRCMILLSMRGRETE